MVLGISSFTYGWSVGVPGQMPPKPLTANDLIRRTLDFGLRCLQIGDNLPLHAFNSSELEELRTLVNDNHIRLELGARMLTPEHLDRYVTLTSFFNAPLLRFVIDGDGYEPDPTTIIRIIKNVLPDLHKTGIVLGIENHDRFKAAELASIMDSIDDRHVGVCLDCVNSLGAGEGLDHVAAVLTPYTVNLHIKDYTIQRLYHKMGFHVTGTPAGKGMTDVPMLLERLGQYKRCQSAVLEQWVEPESSIEATVRKEEAWAVEGIQYLSQLSYFKKKDKTRIQ